MEMRRLAAVGTITLIAVLCCLGSAVVPGDVPPPAEVTSNFENYWGVSLNRDCGYSRQLSNGQGLWLFCDTAWTDLTGSHFVAGSTAAEGPYTAGQVPTGLTELPTPPAAPPPNQPNHGAPQPFLPTPSGLLNPSGQSCTADGNQYPASWITGATAEPDSIHLLITYANVCVTHTATPYLIQGYGIAEYNPVANTIDTQTTVWSIPGTQLQPAAVLGSPVVSDGYLYLYGSACTSWYSGVCATGGVYAARVPADPADWRSAASYRWYRHDDLTADPADATSVIPSVTPAGLSVDGYSQVGHGVVAIVQTDLRGGFQAWQAVTPAGPWTMLTSGKVGSASGSDNDIRRALIGHPDLSTNTELMLSYVNSTDQHVAVAAFPW